MDGTQASALECVHYSCYSWTLPDSQNETVFSFLSTVPCPDCHPKLLLFVGLPSQAQNTQVLGKVVLQRDTEAPLNSTGLAGNATLCSTQKRRQHVAALGLRGCGHSRLFTRRNHGIFLINKNREDLNRHTTKPRPPKCAP